MSNLLLITDVARLRKIFSRLTEDRNIRLRVVNNLEKGGEEIAIEKPDVVFVQTHLSGLSADILIMHLKKQLGRKRSRFVLLASPGQVTDVILKPYQGWLDTSAEDGQLSAELQRLLDTLLSKAKKGEETFPAESMVQADLKPLPDDESPLPGYRPVTEAVPPQQITTELPFPVATNASEPSLEEQGITYAPRQRLKVYSEFNSSFDNAVSNATEPETLDQAAPFQTHGWDAESVDIAETKSHLSKKGVFLLWLIPVVIVVLAITYFQQQGPVPKADPVATNTVSVAMVKPATQSPPHPLPTPVSESAKAAVVTKVISPVSPQDQDRMSDKAVLTAIAENRGSTSPSPSAASGARPTTLPDFIPRAGLDKQFSASNPGWERYKGQVTEFKVLREAQAIKAIQVIDRGGQGVPESFMKGVLRQVTKKPVLNIETAEKKEGYEIQRGRITENIKVVYYRDEHGGKLRAFVMTWQ